MMTINHLANNQTVINNKGYSYLFSYETLIAVLDLTTGTLYEDEQFYSKTTSKYLNRFKASRDSYIKEIIKVNQSELQEKGQ